MVNYAIEKITFKEAIEIGLYDAIKRGETEFSCRYECGKNGVLEFKQQTHIFKDKSGNLCVKKFKDDNEVLKFIEYIKAHEVE